MNDRLRKVFGRQRVFVTGHTGFKGSWLCEWLLMLGAEVTGFSLPPPTDPSLFEQLDLRSRVKHLEGDVRDAATLARALRDAKPDFVFHLAAQPLVRLSYAKPVETWETNVLGTIHVLEALRSARKMCAAVFVTTDKCYENREWLYGYREEDALGGYDPYSSSKASAEIAIAAWRRSFFNPESSPAVRIASARAGNVIGGGDWALDRILPDAIRSLSKKESIPIRNPGATRPWQHVLEPLSGYLLLAAHLASSEAAQPATALEGAFNFGPPVTSNRPVRDLVTEIVKHWPGSWEDGSDPNAPHEAGLLNLSWDKAFHLLGWAPKWNFAETIAKTVGWYRASARFTHPDEFRRLTQDQISEYARES